MTFEWTSEQLKELRGALTAKEIVQQPEMWIKTLKLIGSMKEKLSRYINEIIMQPDFEVIFTGAGTSEYVGASVSVALNGILKQRTHAYGTTDLVVAPQKYFSQEKPTLLVSFARSGNSPESVGAVQAANKICKKIYHLFITCNEEGALEKIAEEQERCLTIILPKETLDQGFAMTSSFSCMYLAVLLAFQLEKLEVLSETVYEISRQAKRLLAEDWKIFRKAVKEYSFDRIVYLGSGAMKGISQEASLKMLELNGGKIAAFFETPMGFRHGPKSVINDSTLCVVFISDDSYTKRYEIDLVRELCRQRQKNRIMIIGNHADRQMVGLPDYEYYFLCREELPGEWLGLAGVVCAQLMAFFKSIDNGIHPDTPCENGNVNRVVKGVTIYPYGE